MGRCAGHLALSVGIATGATIIIIPEKEHEFERDVAERIRVARLAGRNNFGVIVAEGSESSAYEIASKISEETGIDTRLTQLGHVQRGGKPLMRDRVVATNMGYLAVMLLAQGQGNKVVAMQGDNFVSIDIDEALNMTKELDPEAYKMFSALTFLDSDIIFS
jgi:6-phosphofructokinase 1